MAEEPEQAPAEEVGQDKPEDSAPDGTSALPEVAFDEKFDPETLPEELRPAWKHMHGKFTQTQQELSQQRQSHEQELAWQQAMLSDSEFRDQQLRQWGYEIEESESEEEPDEFRDPRVDDLIAQREQEQQQAQAQQEAQALEAQLESEVDALAKSENRTFSDEERGVLLNEVVTAMLSTNQPPDVHAAYQRLTAVKDAWQREYLDSKKAPRVSATGTAGQQKYDFNDPEARQARMAALIEAEQG